MNYMIFNDRPKTSERSNLRAVFMIVSFFNALSMGMIGPLLIPYFISQEFTAIQIGLLLAVQSAALLVFDIPTGVFADSYGRKASLLISFGSLMIIFVGWFVSHQFLLLLALSFAWGIAYTFQSGAKTTLLVDHLGLDSDTLARNRIFARIASAGSAGLLCGGVIAAIVVHYSLAWIWISAALIHLILFVVVWRCIPNDIILHEKYHGQPLTTLWQEMKVKIYAVSRHSTFRIALLLGVVSSLVLTLYGIGYPFLLRETWNVTDTQFGLLGSLAAGMGILGAIIGERVNRRLGVRRSAQIVAIILLVLFPIFAFAPKQEVLFLSFAMIEFVLFGWDPLEQSFINTFTPNASRASFLSVSSTASLMARLVGQIAAGALLVVLSAQSLLVGLGILALFIPFLVIRVEKKSRPE